MKITKERLMEIIKEELESNAFGSDSISTSSSVYDLRTKAKDASSETGIDTKERGIMTRIEANLAKLAQLSNIKSGQTFSLLKRVNDFMEKEIQKLEGDAQNEE